MIARARAEVVMIYFLVNFGDNSAIGAGLDGLGFWV